MRFARLLTVALTLTGCHFAVQGVDGTGGGAPGGSDLPPGSDNPGTGSTPTLPDAPDLGTAASADLAITPGVVGDPCDASHPCETGLSCLTKVGGGGGLTFPAGYCSKTCGGPGPNGACPAGSTCVDVDKAHVCLANCGPANSCSGANRCCDVGGHLSCVASSCD